MKSKTLFTEYERAMEHLVALGADILDHMEETIKEKFKIKLLERKQNGQEVLMWFASEESEIIFLVTIDAIDMSVTKVENFGPEEIEITLNELNLMF